MAVLPALAGTIRFGPDMVASPRQAASAGYPRAPRWGGPTAHYQVVKGEAICERNACQDVG
jgi:hypothetical protein